MSTFSPFLHSGDDEERLIVHLVHGTWPYGPLYHLLSEGFSGRLRGMAVKLKREPGWFEPGSRYYAQLLRLPAEKVFLWTFRWSGSNSFAARAHGAKEFQERLLETERRFPKSRQMVIAHSHGGTLVAQGLAGTDMYVRRKLPPLAAMLCMATPFTYMLPRDRKEEFYFLFAMAMLGWAGLSMVLLWTGVLMIMPSWAMVLSTLGGILAFLLVEIYLVLRSKRPTSMGKLPYMLPVFLLRSTRDEASFVLGFAQILQWATRLFYQPLSLWIILSQLALEPAIASWLHRHVIAAARLSDARLSAIAMTLAMTVLPALYILATIALGIATGTMSPLNWIQQTIEVETTPLGHTSHVKTYRDPGTFDSPVDRRTSSVRHSQIYELDEAIEDTLYIVRDVLQGIWPTLVNSGYEVGRHPRHLCGGGSLRQAP